MTKQELRKIKNWMKSNVKDNLQKNSPWEVNCTALVEDLVANSGLVGEEVLDETEHVVWDIAVDVAEWYEGQQ